MAFSLCSSCEHGPHKKGKCIFETGVPQVGLCDCIADMEVRPRTGINDGPAGSIIPKKENLYMRFDIDDPKYRDTNVGEEMLEPKHGHPNHTFEGSEVAELKLQVDKLTDALSDVVNEMYAIDSDNWDTSARPCIKKAEAILPISKGGERCEY